MYWYLLLPIVIVIARPRTFFVNLVHERVPSTVSPVKNVFLLKILNILSVFLNPVPYKMVSIFKLKTIN